MNKNKRETNQLKLAKKDLKDNITELEETTEITEIEDLEDKVNKVETEEKVDKEEDMITMVKEDKDQITDPKITNNNLIVLRTNLIHH